MSGLDQIKGRLAAATPGPWANGGNGYVETIPEFDLYRFDIMPETIARTELRHEDAELIAHAPTDMARLIKAVEAVNLDGLMAELVKREERWKRAYEIGDLTHDEASQIALEDRWAYAQLAEIRAALTSALCGE